MKIAQVLAELPSDREDALGSIDLMLLAEKIDPQLTAEERILVLRRRAEIEAMKRPHRK